MRPLTVLNVAYPFAPVAPETAGGAEQVLAMLDEALVAAGHQSLVLAAEGSRAAGELIAFPQSAALLDLPTRRQLQSAYRSQLQSTIRSRQPDVVHFHGLDFAEYMPNTRAACVATIHLPPSWYSRKSFEFPVHLVWVSRDQRNASHCGKGDLIPNGVRLDRFYAEGSRESYIVALGRICPEKGYHLALDAANACGRQLRLAGQVFPYSEHQHYFKREVEPRLQGNHLYLGSVCGEGKRALLARAHCLVIPSQVHETSSLVAMEALACGTPVVAMRIGALPEIIDHGRTGWLVERPDELAEAIEAAGQIRPEDCRAAAEQRFSAEQMTQQYLQVYECLAHGMRNEGEIGAIRSGSARPKAAA
jgi:glycosyltransferase involved in cell wall biosynthesis